MFTQKCALIIVVVIISNISYVVYVNTYIELYKKIVMGVVYTRTNDLSILFFYLMNHLIAMMELNINVVLKGKSTPTMPFSRVDISKESPNICSLSSIVN